jgi:hypothetical protein
MFMRGIYGGHAVAPIIVQFDLHLHPVVFFIVSFGAFFGYHLTKLFFVFFSWPSSIVSACWNCNIQWDINHRFFNYHIESPYEWIRRTILFIFKRILVSVHGPWKWAHKSSNLERKFNLIRRTDGDFFFVCLADGDLNLPALTQKVFPLSYHRPFGF